MSWYSKVAWSEGLFLRQQHFQQNDRYLQRLLQNRTRHISPYPWGFANLEIDRALAEQGKFALSSATGIFQDGMPFDMPDTSPLPAAIDVPENAEKYFVWAIMPIVVLSGREVDMEEASSGSRFTLDIQKTIDSSSGIHTEEEIEVAHPRIGFAIAKEPKAGYNCLKIAKILEVRDKAVVFDETFAPPILLAGGHPIVKGWLERVLGWVETKLDSLSRYAADTSAGRGMQNFDYLMLQLLNREVNVLRHLRDSRYTHPVDVYMELLRLSGELWTFSPKRQVPEYKVYNQDDLESVFEPIVGDIQRLLSLDLGRAIRLDLVEKAQNAYLAAVTDRTLFRNATFVVEVSASAPKTQIQQHFAALCKVGPNTKMNDIVQTHLPGIELVHMPTPPPQIRTITDHVYFYLDKSSPLWPEFSVASSIGLHFAGDWPDLELDLWAIMEDK